MATYNNLSDGRPDGTMVGQNASDLVGFHGKAPAAQAAFVGQQSIAALSVSGVVGFTSSTSFSSAMEKINSILTVLINKGLMAAS
jgi:hypothetical protein